MKNYLRCLFVAALVMLCGTSFAQQKAYLALSFPDANWESTGGKDGISNGYTKTYSAWIDADHTFTLFGFNGYGWQNDWTFVRCSRKGKASKASLTTDQPVDAAIKAVVLNVQKFDEANKFNSIKLEVADNADFTNAQTVEMPKDKFVPGYMVFNVPTPAANQYYRISLDMQGVSGNGKMQISRFSFYTDDFTPQSIKNTPANAYSIEQAKSLYDAGEGLLDTVYVKGKVFKAEMNGKKNADIYISADGTETGAIKAYYAKDLNNKDFTADAAAALVGQNVTIFGTLAKYGDTYELGTGCWLVENATTGVNAIASESAADNAPLYNLAGQRVGMAYKGIVVKNGKKYLNVK